MNFCIFRILIRESYGQTLDIQRDLFQNAYANAVKNADAEGRKLPPFESIRNAQSVPTQILHEIKIGLDQVVDSNTYAMTGKMTK
jgi:hypothetical protein